MIVKVNFNTIHDAQYTGLYVIHFPQRWFVPMFLNAQIMREIVEKYLYSKNLYSDSSDAE